MYVCNTSTEQVGKEDSGRQYFRVVGTALQS